MVSLKNKIMMLGQLAKARQQKALQSKGIAAPVPHSPNHPATPKIVMIKAMDAAAPKAKAAAKVYAAKDCNCDATDAKSTLDHLKHALGQKAGLIAKWDGDCKKENAETDEWLKTIEGNSAQNLADFKAREADKGKLTGALETRIAGLKEFIAQLKDILGKLGFHIERTNKLYGTKYDANLQDQTAASLALHDLSLDFADRKSVV